ncbi:TIGR00730 family Rossman fold protein [Lacticaseibacillus nasuensis]|uniref:Cytokinin riboside 5'-monophosphate phosphoribohydrolase n=1 Tax=Lacticaseibacillus nasuensis JCM 17158 TaxID=1291734 RepID=A0A0R1JQA1_9LACO|nr:TIGR00730 family Rossman fold protein [Lacticaseibacillus nasuensis]KRK70369.1 hypothetical protein FD02_GL000433 [Lacticaseibacillus nasuensis JCM 17158]
MTHIAVFCGAASGTDQRFTQAATTLGQWLATHHHTLVYGGGRFGLMGTVATACLAAGGTVIGILPQNLFARGVALPGIKLTITPDMATRKQQMLALSRGCIALPGGPGTLEEISSAFSWARIGDNASPCAFYNVAGYWDPLAAMFDQMVSAGFLTATDRAKLCFSADLATIATFMRDYTPPEIRRY